MQEGFAVQARDLSIGWKGEVLAADIGFCLPAASSMAIIGESGCGKSTLLQTLAGLIPAIKGEAGFVSSQTRTPKKAMVWQSLALFPWMRVRDNLALPLKLAKVAPETVAERVEAMLKELEIESLADRFPKELSGGQRQRLALGRALIAEPDILFMDEPFSAIDAVLREHLQAFLKRLWTRHQCTMIFVTHDISEALYLGETILMLGARPSRMVACGTNPVFSRDAEVDVRNTDAFYSAQRRLHEAFVAARSGRTIRLENATW